MRKLEIGRKSFLDISRDGRAVYAAALLGEIERMAAAELMLTPMLS